VIIGGLAAGFHPEARMLSKTWLSALALTTGLILGASTTALTQTPPPAQTPAQRPAAGGRHPHIMGAERALHHAERQLEEAAHHYGGHRAKALELVKLAEGELREAVAYAQAHPEEFRTPPAK
jgi:DNA-binding NtrC family response regulator